MAKAKYELENGVALITLSDPATLNAIAVDMTEELTVFFKRATEEARCIVLTGEGRAFSSGANLASGAPPMDADGQPDLGGRLEATFNPFVTMLRDLPIPYVTAVNARRQALVARSPCSAISSSPARAPISCRPSVASASCPTAALPITCRA